MAWIRTLKASAREQWQLVEQMDRTFWEVQLNEHSHDKTRQVLDASRCILISTSAVFMEGAD